MVRETSYEAKYLDLIVRPIQICKAYKPKMGRGSRAGLSLEDFQGLYGKDVFYSWFGLDNPLVYTAHKLAGGMTSIYRQIGIGCEALFRAILQDYLGLTEEECRWSYTTIGAGMRARTLSLDARISLNAIRDSENRTRVEEWLIDAARDLDIHPKVVHSLGGVVFEVRQGYKSKDSKRQNADIANAATSYTQAYLPCLVLMSTQMDSDILTRYRGAKWAILTGIPIGGSRLNSTYTFLREVIGYDLAAFFERHAEVLRTDVTRVLETLLRSE